MFQRKFIFMQNIFPSPLTPIELISNFTATCNFVSPICVFVYLYCFFISPLQTISRFSFFVSISILIRLSNKLLVPLTEILPYYWCFLLFFAFGLTHNDTKCLIHMAIPRVMIFFAGNFGVLITILMSSKSFYVLMVVKGT